MQDTFASHLPPWYARIMPVRFVHYFLIRLSLEQMWIMLINASWREIRI